MAPVLRLRRLLHRPVLEPDPRLSWEAAGVFNPAAARVSGRVVLLYRACGPSPSGELVSVLGYAESRDGLSFARWPRPVFLGEGPRESRGVEDPRLTYLEGRWWLVYTAFDGVYVRVSAAWTDRLGPDSCWRDRRVLLDEQNKNGVLLPSRVGSEYVLYHRRYPGIWACRSRDMAAWEDHRLVMSPRPGSWDSHHVGMGPPPVRVPGGWLVLYHGADGTGVYRLGVALLDAADPSRVICRQEEPVLEPELAWEREGLVGNVVFACGMAPAPGGWVVYYGAADTCIGAAWLDRAEVLRWVEAGSPRCSCAAAR